MVLVQRRRDGALLVSGNANPSGEPFHRPLGGHVEFGEYAADTARREFLEEIGQELTDVRQVGVLENIFYWGGAKHHEIVFVFTAAFADPGAYEIPEQTIRYSTAGIRAIWRAPGSTSPPLYPDGTAALALSDREPA